MATGLIFPDRGAGANWGRMRHYSTLTGLGGLYGVRGGKVVPRKAR